MPTVMVVGVSEDFQVSGHELPEEFDPICEVLATVNKSFVPCRCYFFDSLAVPEPTDIGKVRSNQVEAVLHFPWPRHKRRVSQCQRDVALPEHVRKSGIEPLLVSNLDCKFVVGRKLLQERYQHGEKTVLLREFPAVE